MIWLLDTGRLLERDELGRPWAFQGILLDVTEDEEAKARLEASERDQRARSRGVLAIRGPRRSIRIPGSSDTRTSGPQVVRHLRLHPRGAMVDRKHFPRMVHPDDRARVRRTCLAPTTRASSGKTPTGSSRRDGEIRWLHSFGRRVTAERVRPRRFGTASRSTSPPPTRSRRHGRGQEDDRRSAVENPAALVSGSRREHPGTLRAGRGGASPGSRRSRPPAGGSP